MIPYTSFYYFGILAYFIFPVVALGLLFKNKTVLKIWILFTMACLLFLQYHTVDGNFFTFSFSTLYLLLGYVIFQFLLSQLLLWSSKYARSSFVTTFIVILSLLPLLISRFPEISTSLGIGSLTAFAGLSYITFRSLDVIVNIHDGTIKKLPFFQYFAFVAFFSTISAGPIDRYARFEQDWNQERSRQTFLNDFDSGIDHIFRGFLYKFIIAVLINRFWLAHVQTGYNLTTLISYMYGYSLYLFFDFAGYSAFAIGVGNFFGIHSPENFNLPFLSKNIREFWERWHISLSSWFRDHIYTRILFAGLKHKWAVSKHALSYFAYVITMLSMGLWHGFTWYYVAYGIYHALLLITYDLWKRTTKNRLIIPEKYKFLSDAFSIFITVNLVCFGLLVFSGRLINPFQ